MDTTSRLPDNGGATDGASGGALGGLSIADLKRGYGKVPADDGAEERYPDSYPHKDGGFCGRPGGWER